MKSLPTLAAAAVATSVVVGGVALPAGAAEAATRATRVSGWNGHALVAKQGQVVRLRVAVRPAKKHARRTVVLQRRAPGAAWAKVAAARTGKHGVAWLRLPTTHSFDGQLRLWVTATRKATGVVTTPRPLVVRAVASAPSSGSGVSGTSAGGSASGDVPATTSTELEVVRLVNQARATARYCGSERFPAVPALRVDDRLSMAGRAHALDMGRQNYFSHTSADGRSPWDRARAAGTTANAENIAAGQPTPAAVMSSWLQSEGHCRNIMTPDSTRIGVGVANVDGSTYGTYWVQMFGS